MSTETNKMERICFTDVGWVLYSFRLNVVVDKSRRIKIKSIRQSFETYISSQKVYHGFYYRVTFPFQMCVHLNFFFTRNFLNKHDDGGRNSTCLFKPFPLVINTNHMNMRERAAINIMRLQKNFGKKVDLCVKNTVWNDRYVVIIYELAGFIVLIACRLNTPCLLLLICLSGIAPKVAFIF